MPDQFETPVKRDRYNRYLLPDPDTGTERPYTRATTWASTVADTYALTQWKLRMATKGLAMRQDLYALACATAADDKKTLDRVTADALEAAASSAGANTGTAVHALTEQLDRTGLCPDTIPAQLRGDIDAYQRAIKDVGIEILPNCIERITVVPEHAVAGTFDRIVRYDGRLHIADVKTAKDLRYSWGEISIQLALYAHGRGMWDASRGNWTPMPVVDQETAIVIWLPAGQGRCELHEVNIRTGWTMAHLCGEVRHWRKRKDLAWPIEACRPDGAGVELLKAIRGTRTIAELEQLWRDNATAWLPEHTEEAAGRKKLLSQVGQAE